MKALIGFVICIGIICYTWFKVSELNIEFDREMVKQGFEQQIGGWQKIR